MSTVLAPPSPAMLLHVPTAPPPLAIPREGARPPPSLALFAAQNRALHLFARREPLPAVFTALVEAVEADLAGEGVATIQLLDSDGKHLRHGAAPSLPENYNRAIDGSVIGPDIGTCHAAASRNEIVVTVDIASDPNWAEFKALPLGLNLRAAWSLPIRSASGKVLGTFGTYFRTCRAPTPAEREIVALLAKTAAIAIEHRVTLAAHAQKEAFLHGIVGASADCLKVLSLEGRIKWMSANGLCAMEVTDFGQLLDNDWITFWPDESTQRAASAALDAARRGEVGRFHGFCPTLAGTPKWWDVTVTAICDPEGNPRELLSVSREITERKRAEEALTASEERYRALAAELESRVTLRTAELASSNEQLRAHIQERISDERARLTLQQKLCTAQEDERRRISRELHDDVGQDLTALHVGLQALRDGSLDVRADESVGRLEAITENIGKQIHDLALELRPTALDDLGLTRALEHYVDQWSHRSGVPVELHQTPASPARLPPPIETTLYRIIQEALTNVLKHAQARRVSVLIEIRTDHASAIVEDDGVGFDLTALAQSEKHQRLGLPGMHERASLVDGTVKIESMPGRGTAVFVRIPLSQGESATHDHAHEFSGHRT